MREISSRVWESEFGQRGENVLRIFSLNFEGKSVSTSAFLIVVRVGKIYRNNCVNLLEIRGDMGKDEVLAWITGVWDRSKEDSSNCLGCDNQFPVERGFQMVSTSVDMNLYYAGRYTHGYESCPTRGEESFKCSIKSYRIYRAQN